jgi:hypothetical protein
MGGGGGGTWKGLVGSVPETCLWPPEYMMGARCGGEPASSAWESSNRDGRSARPIDGLSLGVCAANEVGRVVEVEAKPKSRSHSKSSRGGDAASPADERAGLACWNATNGRMDGRSLCVGGERQGLEVLGWRQGMDGNCFNLRCWRHDRSSELELAVDLSGVPRLPFTDLTGTGQTPQVAGVCSVRSSD